MREELKDICFFCKERIESRSDGDLEHIIPNSLLRALNIQNEVLHGHRKMTYSRVKVPAHRSCNNGFGSAYENKVLDLLGDPDALYEDIERFGMSVSINGGADDSPAAIISAWLCKIYYGLFYNDYLRDTSLDDDSMQKSVIDDRNFDLIRKSYKDGNAFMLPSSLYAFKSNNDDFDIRTSPDCKVIILKIKSLILALCIGDGCLTQGYFSEEPLESFRRDMLLWEANHPIVPRDYLFAHLCALRMCIPKSPSFGFDDRNIMNFSMSTCVSNPEEFYSLDMEGFMNVRNHILAQIGYDVVTT